MKAASSLDQYDFPSLHLVHLHSSHPVTDEEMVADVADGKNLMRSRSIQIIFSCEPSSRTVLVLLTLKWFCLVTSSGGSILKSVHSFRLVHMIPLSMDSGSLLTQGKDIGPLTPFRCLLVRRETLYNFEDSVNTSVCCLFVTFFLARAVKDASLCRQWQWCNWRGIKKTTDNQTILWQPRRLDDFFRVNCQIEWMSCWRVKGCQPTDSMSKFIVNYSKYFEDFSVSRVASGLQNKQHDLVILSV